MVALYYGRKQMVMMNGGTSRRYRIQPVDVVYVPVEGGREIKGFMHDIMDFLGCAPSTMTKAMANNRLIHGKWMLEIVDTDYWSNQYVYHCYEAVQEIVHRDDLKSFEGTVDEICRELNFDDRKSLLVPYGRGSLVLGEYLMTEVK